MTVTPTPGPNTQTPATAGQSIIAIDINVTGGYITNPADPVDQGLSDAEILYVDQVGNATLQANNTTIALQPGQTYQVIPNATTPVSVASVSPNHMFTAVQWTGE